MEKVQRLKLKKNNTIEKVEQQRKVLLGLECLTVFLIFFSLHYSNTSVIPSFTPWLLIGAFVIVAYLRIFLHKKYYVVEKMGRTRNLTILIRVIPFAALAAYLLLPKTNGINGIAAGLLAASYFYIEDTLTVYMHVDEYNKILKKRKRKKNRK
ncbi:hypothetical protein ACTQ46_04465 [Gallicola sp. Sow4_E12]|uniref:hypothetical protein n=1 Tax=Gallicola sp. Sow4_E12 TaxID=3438785 RepID=UPI003F919ACC